MKEKNIRLFYAHELLFQFSDSMLIIVLPVFLYKLFGSISAVFLFTFSWNLIYSVIFIPIFNLAMHMKNPKYFMAMGMVFYVTALGLLSNITPENIQLIIPATIVFALYISCYWMIRHWFFSVNADYTKIGKQISTLTIIRILIGFIAPIVGGVISFLVSFNVTFVLGAIAGTFSLIPILLFHAPPHPRGYDFKKVIGILNKPDLKAIRPAYFWEGSAANFIGTAWLLAFAIFIGNILELGLLVGITTLAAAILTWLTGSWFDQRKRKAILTRITKIRFLTVMLYVSIFFYPNIIYVWLIELFNKLAVAVQYTIVDSYLFAYSNKIHPIHFHLNREIHLNISRFISSGLLAIAFYFLPANYLWVSIGIGAFMIFGWLTLKRSDHLLH
ncbi:hypothetical protein KKF04_02095 [Patescibacteria group bacterium]|nr:hypothetical protein [Patescibacteria group bacterium]